MDDAASLTRRMSTLALLVVSLSLLAGSDSSSQTRAASQPIRQIDHIMIRTGDPRELYAFFAETLQLPIAWPLTSPRPGVMTGGIGFGNVNVETNHDSHLPQRVQPSRVLRCRMAPRENQLG